MKENNKYLEYLEDSRNHYLIKNNLNLEKAKEFLPNDFYLYHIQELTFEEKAPRKEALENVLSAMRIDGINFIYLIVGDGVGVNFYFGVARDLSKNKELELNVSEVGNYILKPSITGNFRGSKVKNVENTAKYKLKEKINNFNYHSVVEGVPGINEDNENFQGVDRLVDVMLGDEFCVSIIASPLNKDDIINIEKYLYEAYSAISYKSKDVIQIGNSKSDSKSEGTSETSGSSKNKGRNDSKSKSTAKSEGETETETENDSITIGKNKSESKTKNESNNSTNHSSGENSSKTNGSSNSKGTNKGKTETETFSYSNNYGESESKGITNSKNVTVGETTSENKTLEYADREAQEWIKYLDDVVIPRIDYGKSKGTFMTTTILSANHKATLMKLGNTMKSLYSGVKGNKVPLEMYYIENNNYLDYYKNFQIPKLDLKNDKNLNNKVPMAVLSQYKKEGDFKYANWISTNELSIIAGLPQKEVVGLSLKEEVEFGLNFKQDIDDKNKIKIGKLVQSGNKTDIDVYIDKDNLNKHTFITGVTGSGKTTTCQNILMSSDLPFMVIEPAKTEYRILTESYNDIIIFTLGKENIAPFRLNPFEFYEHENISSRVDMIKACIEASFDMEAAIPQIIESAIYECYEDLGWNIATNKNMKYKYPFIDGVYAFPTISDLISKTEDVVNRQGFDERLKRDYIGSIKARLQGLAVGSKGLMLDTKRSINFKELVNRKVIIELEEIKNANEKSLIMGFILLNLNEAIKANFYKDSKFKHITLVEEAHRLLSKYEPGDSLNKKQGVEVFTDMLAEVRKYGESLIIVDQIPNKLTSEILKNTNTKIVHKIFAQDDKDAIGNTMALKEEQKEFMSSLDVGRAIVFTQGWDKALQVQIDTATNTTGDNLISDKIIRRKALQFYQENYKTGVFLGMEMFKNQPSVEEVDNYIEFLQDAIIVKEYKNLVESRKSRFKFKEYIENKSKIKDLEIVAGYLTKLLYEENDDVCMEEIRRTILNLISSEEEEICLKGEARDILRCISRRD